MSISLYTDNTYVEFILSKATQRILFRWGGLLKAGDSFETDVLPASVRGKINMIRLLKPGDYVAGLGGKKSSSVPELCEFLSVQLDEVEAEQLLKLNPHATKHSIDYDVRHIIFDEISEVIKYGTLR